MLRSAGEHHGRRAARQRGGGLPRRIRRQVPEGDHLRLAEAVQGAEDPLLARVLSHQHPRRPGKPESLSEIFNQL